MQGNGSIVLSKCKVESESCAQFGESGVLLRASCAYNGLLQDHMSIWPPAPDPGTGAAAMSRREPLSSLSLNVISFCGGRGWHLGGMLSSRGTRCAGGTGRDGAVLAACHPTARRPRGCSVLATRAQPNANSRTANHLGEINPCCRISTTQISGSLSNQMKACISIQHGRYFCIPLEFLRNSWRSCTRHPCKLHQQPAGPEQTRKFPSLVLFRCARISPAFTKYVDPS